MAPLKCSKCGYVLQNDESEKFCPNCGSLLTENNEGTLITPEIVNRCPACNTPITTTNAKFCPSCGGALQIEAPINSTGSSANVQPPQNAPVTTTPQQTVLKKLVVGALVKSVPFANIIVPGGKISGSVQLRRDGVLFITKAREVIQSHILDIVDVKEEPENNVITITMRDGERKTFSFAGARKWVEMIHQLQAY